MSIKHVLPLAVLLAIAACAAGPNAICSVDPSTEWTVCEYSSGTSAQDIPLPGDDRVAADAQP
jgi:hypothetical protein